MMDAQTTAVVVSRADAAAFRDAAHLSLDWDDAEGAPEPPLDAIERTRRLLELRQRFLPQIEITPDTNPWPDQGSFSRFYVAIHRAIDVFPSLVRTETVEPADPPRTSRRRGRESPLALKFMATAIADRNGKRLIPWSEFTQKELVAQIDQEYERRWRLGWRFGVGPDAAGNARAAILDGVREVLGDPERALSLELRLAQALPPEQSWPLFQTLHRSGWRSTLGTRRIGTFDAFAFSGIAALMVFVLTIAAAIVLRSAWMIPVIVAVPMAIHSFCYRFARSVWKEPNKTLAELAGDLHDVHARDAEAMIAHAARPWAASDSSDGASAA